MQKNMINNKLWGYKMLYMKDSNCITKEKVREYNIIIELINNTIFLYFLIFKSIKYETKYSFDINRI